MKTALLPTSLCLIALFSTGCSSTGATPVGVKRYAPLPENEDVVVFTSEAEVSKPYEVVGIISHSNPGKYQVLTLADAVPILKQEARELGANGVIIDSSNQVRSGIVSRGVYVEARAIRFMATEEGQ